MCDHTPGPWESIRATTLSDGEHDYGIAARDLNGGVLAEAFGRNAAGSGGRLPAEANARLIAAAPDLLEALQEIVEDITHEDHEPGDWSVQSVVRRARAAIAKATHVQDLTKPLPSDEHDEG